MTKWILLLLSAAVLSAATPDAKTEKEVMAAWDAYKQALMKKDAAAMAKAVTDDLSYTHSSAMHQDKAALLESLKQPATTVAVESKNVKVQVYGNTATVKGDYDFSNKNAAGAVTVNHLSILHVFVKGPSGWQLAARQATKYPEPAAK